MDRDFLSVKDRLIQSVFRIKHLGSIFHSGMDAEMTKCGISITEFTLMKAIENNESDSDGNTGISDIQQHLFITKAAVSKMLGVLEKKGYVNREVNRRNRRTLLLTLTAEGREVVGCLEAHIDGIVMEIIKRLVRPTSNS